MAKPEDYAGVHTITIHRTADSILSTKARLQSHRCDHKPGRRPPLRSRQVQAHASTARRGGKPPKKAIYSLKSTFYLFQSPIIGDSPKPILFPLRQLPYCGPAQDLYIDLVPIAVAHRIRLLLGAQVTARDQHILGQPSVPSQRCRHRRVDNAQGYYRWSYHLWGNYSKRFDPKNASYDELHHTYSESEIVLNNPALRTKMILAS